MTKLSAESIKIFLRTICLCTIFLSTMLTAHLANSSIEIDLGKDFKGLSFAKNAPIAAIFNHAQYDSTDGYYPKATIRIVNWQTGKLIRTIQSDPLQQGPSIRRITDDGRFYIFSGNGTNVRVWDLSNGNLVFSKKFIAGGNSGISFGPRIDETNGIIYFSDDIGYQNPVVLYPLDMKTWSLGEKIVISDSDVHGRGAWLSYDVMPGGKYLWLVSADACKSIIYEVETKKIIRSSAPYPKVSLCYSNFTQISDQLALAHDRSGLRLINLETMQPASKAIDARLLNFLTYSPYTKKAIYMSKTSGEFSTFEFDPFTKTVKALKVYTNQDDVPYSVISNGMDIYYFKKANGKLIVP